MEADPSFLDRYLKGEESREQGHASPSQPQSRSQSSYSSVVTMWKPDGVRTVCVCVCVCEPVNLPLQSYEEKRIVRDDKGNEQVQ